MIRNLVCGHSPPKPRNSMSLYYGNQTETVHDLLGIGDVRNECRDDASVSSRSTRPTIQSGELDFGENGDLARPVKEQEAGLHPAITLEDLINVRQSRTNDSVTSLTAVTLAPRRRLRPSIAEPSTRKAEKALRDLPAYLRPFVPYIEKKTDETMNNERKPNAGTMNVDIIRCWLNGCDEHHRVACYSNQDLRSRPEHGGVPLYLMDVKDGSLILTPSHVRYVALRYVWGGARLQLAL
jgi:hypothetical protein